MINQQIKVGVANNDKRAKCWCGTGKVGVATTTPAIRHSPSMYLMYILLWMTDETRSLFRLPAVKESLVAFFFLQNDM